MRRFVGKIGEKNMALQGIVLGFVAFLLLSLPRQKHGFSLPISDVMRCCFHQSYADCSDFFIPVNRIKASI